MKNYSKQIKEALEKDLSIGLGDKTFEVLLNPFDESKTVFKLVEVIDNHNDLVLNRYVYESELEPDFYIISRPEKNNLKEVNVVQVEKVEETVYRWSEKVAVNDKELIKVLNSIANLLDEYEYYNITPDSLEQDGNFSEEESLQNARDFLLKNNLIFELVEQQGGMDEGSNYYVIFKVDTGEEVIYFKDSTFYASHYGIEDWFGAKRVYPKEVTKIEYSVDPA